MTNNGLFKAVEIIIDSNNAKLKFDKTIIGTIKQVIDVYSGQYRIEYEAGGFTAYAQDISKTYCVGQSVYIKVPEGDFSNRKTIEGLVSDKTEDTKKNKDLSQTEVLASKSFNLQPVQENGEEFWVIKDPEELELFKTYVATYLKKERGFIKLFGIFQNKISEEETNQ